MVAGFEEFDREAPPTLDVGRRTGIAEVEAGYDDDAARTQAARCLVCHVQTIYDPELCVLCNRCVDVCPEYCLAIVPFDDRSISTRRERAVAGRARARPNGLPLAAMVKDDDRCIRCGLCAIRCPTDAMTMERFTITERFAGGAAWQERHERKRSRRLAPAAIRRDFLFRVGTGAGIAADRLPGRRVAALARARTCRTTRRRPSSSACRPIFPTA